MTRCLNCGADRRADQCEECGLTSAAAELLFRRRLVNLTGVFLLGAVAFLSAGHFYPPLDLDAMMIFVGVLFFFSLGLAAWLDFGARRHAEIEAFRRIFRGLVPVPCLLAALLFVNGRFDNAPPRHHVTSVVGKFAMPGSLHISRLVVTSWRPGRRLERLPVSREDYARFAFGDQVQVRVQEGLAGIPWLYAVYRK